MEGIAYLSYEDYLYAAAEALTTDLETIRRVARQALAESALAAPAAGFGDHDHYPHFPDKAAVLLQRVASNHALPDGNKRTALLCAVLFANLNGWDWVPPAADDPDGSETAEVVEAAAAGGVPLAALSAWVDQRLVDVLPTPQDPPDSAMTIFPAEYVGPLSYEHHTLRIGDLVIQDVHGFNPASVFVRRIGGKVDGISVAEVIISAVGDGYAQEELDSENAEAQRYPLGPKEYWRARMVGKYTNPDGQSMTDEDFEIFWDEDT